MTLLTDQQQRLLDCILARRGIDPTDHALLTELTRQLRPVEKSWHAIVADAQEHDARLRANITRTRAAIRSDNVIPLSRGTPASAPLPNGAA